MLATQQQTDTKRYAKCIEVSKRIRWEIDRDVIRGRKFDFSRKFLPDGLSLVDQFEFLSDTERRYLSQVQGRSYANMFGLAERFIGAKLLELSRDHWLGDQTALEALVRFTDEELKHQELFRELERMMGEGMPAGYKYLAQPNDVASIVLGKSTWAVLALTCNIELFTQAHYRQSVQPDDNLSDLFKDVLLFHWKEESQHAIIDELEWQREDGKLSAAERDRAVTDLIDLVAAVDGILQAQTPVDVEYFAATCGRKLKPAEMDRLRAGVLKAYRWQFIGSGAQEPRFTELLGSMTLPQHGERIGAALAPIVGTA